MKQYCHYCNNEFEGRADAKFCSAKHRVAYSRLSEKIRRNRNKAVEAIRELMKIDEEFPEFSQIIDDSADYIRSNLELSALGTSEFKTMLTKVMKGE